MIPLLLAIFQAIAAIPTIAGYAEKFAQGIMLWFVQRQQRESLAAIADAASLAARAENDDERYAAAEAWKKALSLPRVTL